jgi:hypothetical protein
MIAARAARASGFCTRRSAVDCRIGASRGIVPTTATGTWCGFGWCRAPVYENAELSSSWTRSHWTSFRHSR